MNLTVNVLQTDFTNQTPLSVDAGGISINGDSNGGSSTSHTVVVTDGDSATIVVQQTGFRSYTMDIDNVYNQDLSIDVLLVPTVTDTADSNYNKPVPKFFTVYDLCGFCVDVYNSSSFAGEISWYVNNELLTKSTKERICFCTPGDYQIKIRNVTKDFTNVNNCPVEVTRWDLQWATNTVGITGNTVAQDVDAIETYLALDTNTNTTIVEYRVDIILDPTINPDPTVDEKACYYNRGETSTITPTITLNRAGADPALHNLTYIVTDPKGIETEYTFTLDEVDLTVDITFSELGVYTVLARVEDTECGNIFEKTIELETCNFIYTVYKDCKVYTIENRSSTTSFDYSFRTVEGTDAAITGTIAAGGSVDINLPLTHIYIMTATYTRDAVDYSEEYVFANYCELENCISTYIMSVLCGGDNRCDPCPDDSVLNQMLLFYNTYFMKLHKLYALNNFFTSLSDEQLTELTTIQQIADKMSLYCSRLSCTINGDTFDNPGATYDWAGAGNNCEKTCNCNPAPSGSYYPPNTSGYCSTCNGTI